MQVRFLFAAAGCFFSSSFSMPLLEGGELFLFLMVVKGFGTKNLASRTHLTPPDSLPCFGP